MVVGTENVEMIPGYITLTDSHGRKTKHKIELELDNIPTGLTYTKVPTITTLANLVVVLIRTLIAKGVLDENFLEEGEYDLALITAVIEGMGGSYGEPVISP